MALMKSLAVLPLMASIVAFTIRGSSPQSSCGVGEASESAGPNIVWVLPVPVCPYANRSELLSPARKPCDRVQLSLRRRVKELMWHKAHLQHLWCDSVEYLILLRFGPQDYLRKLETLHFAATSLDEHTALLPAVELHFDCLPVPVAVCSAVTLWSNPCKPVPSSFQIVLTSSRRGI